MSQLTVRRKTRRKKEVKNSDRFATGEKDDQSSTGREVREGGKKLGKTEKKNGGCC